MARPLRAPVLLLLVAGLLAGCSDEPSGESPAESTLAEAERVSSEYGARFVFDGTFTEDGETISFSGHGAVEAGGERDHLVTRAAGTRIDQFTDGRFLVMSAGVLPPALTADLPAGTRWMRVDQEALAEEQGVSGEALTQLQSLDPARQLATYRSLATEISEIGPARVRGEPTTRYRMLVSLKKAVEAVTADPEDPPEAAEAVLETEVPFDVWVDSSGRVRRVEMSISLEGEGVSVTSEVTALDRNLRIDVPSGPSVHEVTKEEFGG